jgi:hypothetical protein
MRYLPVILLVVLFLIASGCTSTKQETVTPQTTTMVSVPTPEPTVTRPLPGMDPIIGAWDNGMVFSADGTVSNDRNVTWKANKMEKYSYFVTTESGYSITKEGLMRNDPTAQSREWIYNPNSDTIYMRGTTVTARRVLMAP